MKVGIAHDIDAFFTIPFLEKNLSKDSVFFFKSKIGNCKIFKNLLDEFFSISN